MVTIKQCTPLSKFDKWWMGKCMCIEGVCYIHKDVHGCVDNFNKRLMYICV